MDVAFFSFLFFCRHSVRILRPPDRIQWTRNWKRIGRRWNRRWPNRWPDSPPLSSAPGLIRQPLGTAGRRRSSTKKKKREKSKNLRKNEWGDHLQPIVITQSNLYCNVPGRISSFFGWNGDVELSQEKACYWSEIKKDNPKQILITQCYRNKVHWIKDRISIK